MQRQKLAQNSMAEKLMLLMPNAKFSVRPVTEDENVLRALDNPVIRSNMLIDWNPENGECPSLEAIEAISEKSVEDMHETKRKQHRDQKYKDDLSVKAAFMIEKKSDANLKFSDYLDMLEAVSVQDNG